MPSPVFPCSLRWFRTAGRPCASLSSGPGVSDTSTVLPCYAKPNTIFCVSRTSHANGKPLESKGTHHDWLGPLTSMTTTTTSDGDLTVGRDLFPGEATAFARAGVFGEGEVKRWILGVQQTLRFRVKGTISRVRLF